MAKNVNIIGGGLGGLVTAIRLAHHGFNVNLFEKNGNLGGKMNQRQFNGFTFDTGPSLLTMPFVIQDFFDSINAKMQDHIELEPIEPICRYFYDDGTIFNASSNFEHMLQNIKNLDPSQTENFKRYFKYTQKIYELTTDVFLLSPIHELNKILKWKNLSTLFQIKKIDAFRSVHKANASFFNNEKLIQLFDRYTTYNGSNPFQAPATLNTIPYVEYGLGGYYIKGGMYNLVKALEKIANDKGVNIHLNSHVTKIRLHKNRVLGVELENEFHASDFTVCNTDTVFTFESLLNKKSHYTKLEPSSSGMVFMWGVEGNHEQLAHHNTLFSSNYKHEFDELFFERKNPQDPTVYIAITSKKDSAHAPKNHENWFVLVNTPYITNHNWEKEKKIVRNNIIKRIEKTGISISEKIIAEQTFSPQDILTTYNSNKGSIYGLSSNSQNAAFKRPANRNRKYKGLYFANGSAHPGGGIPLVFLSGKMAANLIAEQEKINVNW